jgi:anti-sigma factor RsiW
MSESNNNPTSDDELLSAYVDGELTAEERAAVEARLASDPSARELVAEMQALSGTLRSLPREKVVDDVRGGVLNQIPEKRVTLPPRDISMGRRLLWPMLAIAVALMLMFIQENEKPDVGEVAKVEADRDAAAPQPERRREIAAVDAPTAVSAPRASSPVISAPAGESTVDALRTAPPAEEEPTAEDSRLSGNFAKALASNESGVGIVHLTLTDFRSGAEHFDRLLLSNGVQVLDDAENETQLDASSTSEGLAFDRAESTEEAAPVMRSYSAPSASDGAGGYGGVATSNAPPAPSGESESEPEMVLVEAPPEQIAQILLGCSNDTAAIQEVSIDPTASGTNLAPEKQQLSQYRQYERGASNESKLKGYNVTRSQQGMIAALNSMEPPLDQAEHVASDLQNQGWATRVRGLEQPADSQQLGAELNNRRNQFYSNSRQQQAAPAQQKLAKKEATAPQSMRVLFLLHPSEDAATKK